VKIENQTQSNPGSDHNVAVLPAKDLDRTDADATMEWLLPYQIPEPTLWPRVLPGL
jgi:hypothetical protein